MEEIWKAIPNYEGLYEASNVGNIKRVVGFRCREEWILKQKTTINGYKSVQLFKDGIAKDALVHRVIAETFIDNINNYKTVNHKNGIKIDNNINNLEWLSYSDNHKHAYNVLGRINPKGMSGKKKVEIVVEQYTMDGILINKYTNVFEASRKTNINYHSIYACCHGKCKSGYNYLWKYNIK